MERAEPARPSGAGVHAECFRPLGSARLGLEAESQRDVRRLEPERRLRQRRRRIERGPSLMPRFLIQREIPNAELIREHARLGGFPADSVLEVAAIIDPTTAESNDLAATARL